MPAAPRLALTRLYASQTSRLEMLNGFALSSQFLPSLVDLKKELDDATPLLSLAFTKCYRYYGLLRPCAEHRYV